MDPYIPENLEFEDAAQPEEQPLAAFPWGDKHAEGEIKTLLTEHVSAALGSKTGRDAKVRRLRDMYELIEPDRDPAFPGGANYMVPLVRGKVDAIVPLLADALIRDPFVSVTAHNPEADNSRQVFEEFLDVTMDALRMPSHVRLGAYEAVISSVHISKVGVVGVEKSDSVTGDRVTDAELTLDTVAYENFLVHPATVTKLEDAFFIADRFWKPYFELEAMADRNEILNCDDLVVNLSDPNVQGNQAMEIQASTITSSKGAQYHELFECWFQWEEWEVTDPVSGALRSGTMWRAWWQQHSQTLLLCEPNPHWHAQAPYTMAGTQARVDSVWGHGVAEVLEGTQNETNTTTNQRIDAQSWSVAPIFEVESGGVAEKFLKKNPFRPGLIVPSTNMQNPALRQIPIAGANSSSLQDIALLRQMADWATLADGVLAQPIAGANPTATEVRDTRFAANLKSKFWLSNLREGYKDLALLISQMTLQYQIAPKGEETGRKFVTKSRAQTAIKNSDVRLEDFDVQVNGSEVRDARLERAAIWERLGPQLLPLITQATNPDGTPGKRAVDDSRIWTYAKALLDAHDISDWESYIGSKPPDPNEVQRNEQMIAALRAQQTAGQNPLVEATA